MLPENANESLLRYILTTIKKNIIVIIIFTAFVGAISFFYSKYFIIPEYESSATMIIVMETDSEVDYDDVAFSKNLVDTYVIILKNDAFLQKVIDELSLSSDTESLYDSITINGLRNTEVLSLTVRDTDPAKAKAIADKITELAPAEISRTVRAGSIEIVNPAGEAHLVSPDLINNTCIGVFTGFTVICLLVFLIKLMDNKFKSEGDIRDRLGYPILGTTPYFKFKSIKKDVNRIYEKIPYQMIEAFNTIRLNLKYVSVDKNIKKIIVASSAPNEGKTVTVINLAVALARLGKRVLVIDMDFRKPSVNKYLHLTKSYGVGVTSVIADNTPIAEAIINCPDLGISVLLTGPLPPNPNEMLQSNAIGGMIRELEKSYEYIIYDTPPISIFADALTLLPLADGILFVVRYNFTTFETAQKSKKSFETANASVIGCILNACAGKNSNGYYSYHKLYGYK